ncbi:MAG: hypothetical protein ACYC39_13150 [Thiobacillus sp.]|nr:MAG: hypothetical protein B7Y27_15000 [Hydrogenophilales bacterium 16-64-40]OZA31829.1 MAG: hypothetical protein B7X82_15205 [Hydrogenophilales bacterium 17-64-65]HQT32917.1 hypothetical protein [Thiobacillus sp.]
MATALTIFDNRPFFDKALRYGVAQDLIPPGRLQSLQEEFSKGIVQIANFFGTAHLRPELELALHRMVNLVSLYLEDMSEGDLQIAAASLRDKTLLSHSKAGSDMLKRLHAMPDSTLVDRGPVSAERQRAYLDDKTASDTIPLAEYRSELALRQTMRNTIDFAFWLAKTMGIARDDIDDAEPLIRSAMLVIFVDQAELKLPTRTAFVRLFKSAKNPKAKLNQDRLKAFLREAPTEFQQLAGGAMDRFIERDLPQIRAASSTADKLLYSDAGENYFISESVDDDVREYDRLVAKEWDRVTRGEADDPAVVATVFFFVATGLPPKASMLLREAKDVIGVFRSGGFDPQAVIKFVDDHAPEAIREELQKFWTAELKPEAEEQLSDLDPNWPDTHMERALEYLRKTCRVTWKARRR